MLILTGKVPDFIDQKLHSFLTDLQLGLGYRRQGRDIIFGDLVVVEPHDRDILSSFDPGLSQGADDADSCRVCRCENGVGQIFHLQQPICRPPSSLEGQAFVEEGLAVGVDAGFPQSCAVALLPQRGGTVKGAG